MSEDKKKQMWHGIPRETIPWHPTVDADKCIGCSLCYVSCGRGVYEMEDNKSIVMHPMNCMVGCNTCAMVCPSEAITFPERELIRKIERESKIFKFVKEEAKEKKTKQDALKARAAAEDKFSNLTTRVRFEIAGEFGEKRFLVQLEDAIRETSKDIVNLRLEVPTVKGAFENTPSFMVFEVTSEGQEDIQDFLPAIRELVRKNGLVLIGESKS